MADTEDFADKRIEITNDSYGPISIVSVAIGDDTNFSADFSDSCPESGITPFSLPAGESCHLLAKFHPEDVAHYVTDIEIGHLGSGGTLEIPLAGNGVPAGEISVELLNSPDDDLYHDFGYQYPESAWLTIKIANLSNHELQVTSIFPLLGHYRMKDSENCRENPIAGHGSCSFGVKFDSFYGANGPSVRGVFEGGIRIEAYDSDEPVTTVHLRAEIPETTWVPATVASGQDGVDMVVEDSGGVHLCYYSGTEVTYATSFPLHGHLPDGGSWETTVLESFAEPQQVRDCAIVVDQNLVPHIVFLVTDPDLSLVGLVMAKYSNPNIPEPKIAWEADTSAEVYGIALTTDEDGRPHIVIHYGKNAHYVSGNSWFSPANSSWNESHRWADISSIKFMGIREDDKMVLVFDQISSTEEVVAFGSDMYTNLSGFPAWHWTDLTMNLDPPTDSIVVDVDLTAEALTAAGTMDNILQVRKIGLKTVTPTLGDPYLEPVELAEEDSGF